MSREMNSEQPWLNKGYIVYPLTKPNMFTWHHNTEQGALEEAKKISIEYNCDVLIAKVIGKYNATPTFEKAEDDIGVRNEPDD